MPGIKVNKINSVRMMMYILYMSVYIHIYIYTCIYIHVHVVCNELETGDLTWFNYPTCDGGGTHTHTHTLFSRSTNNLKMACVSPEVKGMVKQMNSTMKGTWSKLRPKIGQPSRPNTEPSDQRVISIHPSVAGLFQLALIVSIYPNFWNAHDMAATFDVHRLFHSGKRT